MDPWNLEIPKDVVLDGTVLGGRRVWFDAFLRVPGATITLSEWSQLSHLDKVAAMQAGVALEAERLVKLSKAVQGGVDLADAISEADDGMLRDTMLLSNAVDKAARRLSGAHAT